jgi:hypothetical protein
MTIMEHHYLIEQIPQGNLITSQLPAYPMLKNRGNKSPCGRITSCRL